MQWEGRRSMKDLRNKQCTLHRETLSYTFRLFKTSTLLLRCAQPHYYTTT